MTNPRRTVHSVSFPAERSEEKGTDPRGIRRAKRFYWRADARLMGPLPSLCGAKLAGDDKAGAT